MARTVNIDDAGFKKMVQDIARDILLDGWMPDYIVGITRGGLYPALLLSHYLDVPMHTLKVSLRDHKGFLETNCWMPEDAVGYIPVDERESTVDCASEKQPDQLVQVSRRKNILIVDDINDTGNTLNWIRDDWKASVQGPGVDDAWNECFNGGNGSNVRVAVVVNNLSSEFQDVHYYGSEINKAEDDSWIVFPYEDFWKR